MSLSLKLVRGLELVVLVKLVQLVVELAHLKHLSVQLAIAAWPHIVLVKCLNFTLQAPNPVRGVPATLHLLLTINNPIKSMQANAL